MNRIKSTAVLLAITLSHLIQAQQIEDIQGMVKESKLEAYYETQAKLWKQKTNRK